MAMSEMPMKQCGHILAHSLVVALICCSLPKRTTAFIVNPCAAGSTMFQVSWKQQFYPVWRGSATQVLGTRNIVDAPSGLRIGNGEQVQKNRTSTENRIDDSFLRLDFERGHQDNLRVLKTIPLTDKEEAFVEHHFSLPFSLIVNQLFVKQALVIAATDPSLGIVLFGPKGTAKSVLAKSIHPLLPRHSSGKSPPLVQIPLNCQEDALLGTVDLERSLEKGETVFEPGLLSSCSGGLLIVDDLHLLDEDICNMLLNAIQDGQVTIEREGLSTSYPCRPLLIATMNPEEGEVRSLDRVAMVLPVLSSSLSVAERVQVVENVEGFQDKTLPLNHLLEDDQDIKLKIHEARSLLPQVKISREQMMYLCEEATRADCEGQRAELFATKIAKCAAAIRGTTTVSAADLQLGVLISIAPRARRLYTPSAPDQPQQDSPEETVQEGEQGESQPSIDQLTPLPQPPPVLEEEAADGSDRDSMLEENENSCDDESDEELSEEDLLTIPEQFMFGVDTTTPIDPRLLMFQQWSRRGSGGKRSKIFNLLRGRFVKAIFPKGSPRGRSIAVGATLRAAAPYQRHRREVHKCERLDARKAIQKDRLVYIRDSDIRIKRLKRKSGSLIMFIVDASGSMALNRMGAAKGAATMLLQEAYKSRDKICLVAFHDNAAEVIVPPTKSISLTKSRLERMPCGGRSPLAHAMVTGLRTALNAIKVKKDVGKVIMVLITDGRPTVPLCVSEGEDFRAKAMKDVDSKDGSPSRKFCQKEVFAIAKQFGALKEDVHMLVVDTEDKFVATGVAAEIARLARGNYYALGGSNVADLAAVTRQHVDEARHRIAVSRAE